MRVRAATDTIWQARGGSRAAAMPQQLARAGQPSRGDPWSANANIRCTKRLETVLQGSWLWHRHGVSAHTWAQLEASQIPECC